MRDLYIELENKILRNKYIGKYFSIIITVIISFLFYSELEVCNKNMFLNGPLFTFINILCVFMLICVLRIILQKWWLSSLLVGIPITILSIANYFTLVFRNQPISTQDIHNAGTALNVLNSYKLKPSFQVVLTIILFAISIFFIIRLKKVEKTNIFKKKNILIKGISTIVLSVIFVYVTFLSPKPIKPKETMVWSWQESYYHYGYIAMSVEVLMSSLNPVAMPSDYNDADVNALAEEVMNSSTASGDKKPDIIFILNETFFDLRNVMNLHTDKDFMPFIDNLKNKISGYAVVPGNGGGTNKSEYEFLTGNSLQLMQGITPFNSLDLKNSNSIVSMLKSEGYSTWAGHCAAPLNYNRSRAYPALGFDNVKFIDDFKNVEKYGSRYYATDKSVYKTMLDDYEKMNSSPRFMYMLTIQNHGDWNINDSSLDTIHVTDNYGEYTDSLNEFLSCISLSDMAFKELTEYFSDVDRPVIICIVGDHSPSFTEGLLSDKANDMSIKIKMRATPFVIWANYDIENKDLGYISLPYLTPNLLKYAGCNTSPYFQYMLKVQNQVPVLTAFDLYLDNNFNIYNYNDKTKFTELINNYYKLEYNNTGKNAKKFQKLFDFVQTK